MQIITNKYLQKQPSRGVFRKRYSENMQQIYRRTPMPKCNFNKVALLRHGCSPVKLLHIFRIFLRTPLEGCFLNLVTWKSIIVYLTKKFKIFAQYYWAKSIVTNILLQKFSFITIPDAQLMVNITTDKVLSRVSVLIAIKLISVI